MKRILLSLFAVVMVMSLYAGKVTKRQAYEIAQHFMPGKSFASSQPDGSLFSRSSGSDAFYIFNVENDGGFVIVSADDRTESVLGYSTSGAIDMTNLPDNFRSWLEGYAEEINNLPDNYQPVRASAKTRAAMAAIDPLIKTTWSQGKPYNLMCPYDGESQCVTGCVATAQAQVMYYHQWPETSTAIPAYVTKKKQISVDALPATSFKWDKMKTTYSYNETGDAADAVAELMRYCGQSNEMDYTASSSGASYTLDAMMNYFGYSVNMKYARANDYAREHWESIIYKELEEGRPVLYRGGSLEGEGHAFVCDGYDGNGLFHLNWGWGGSCNGNFVLSAADPHSPGAEGGTSTAGYSVGQRAVLGLKPGYDGEVEFPTIRASLSFIIQEYTRQSASDDFEDISLDEYVSISYNYDPSSTLDLEIGWGLYQNEQLVLSFSSGEQTAGAQKGASLRNKANLAFGKDLADGTYSLREIYRIPGTSEWILCSGYLRNSLSVEIAGTSMVISRTDTGSTKFAVNSMTSSKYPQVGASVMVKANITNQGDETSMYVCLWSQKQGSSTWKRVGYTYLRFENEETIKDAIISFTPEETGDYNLKITNNFSDESLGSSQISVSDVELITVDEVKYSCAVSYGKAFVVGVENKRALKNAILPSTVTVSDVEYDVVAISDKAFQSSYNLQKVVIPEGVERIGKSAFRYCQSLQVIELPSTLEFIGEYATSGTDNLKAVVSHITSPFEISDEVFGQIWYDDNVKSYIPSPATLYVPVGSLQQYQAISGWTHFANMEEGELKETKVGDLNYRYSTGSNTASVIRGDYSELTEVTIPTSVVIDSKTYNVKTIGTQAFQDAYNLLTVTFEGGLESIENQAFGNCSNLTSLVIPEGVKSIGNNAFRYCSSLQKLDLPSTLTSIDYAVIYYCNNLTAVISRIQEPFEIADNTFVSEEYVNEQWVEIPSTATLFVPEGTMQKYQAIAGWTQFANMEEGDLKEATVGGLNYLCATGSKTATLVKGDYAELERAVIPSSITVDGVAYSVVSISNYAFTDCRRLKSVLLPTSMRTIGEYAFRYCSNITKLSIPEGVESIGSYAFNYCYYLEFLELPSTLTSVGDYVIAGCSRLTAVYSHQTDPVSISDVTFCTRTWNSDTQSYLDNPSAATLYMPKGTLSAYKAISGWTKFANMEEYDANYSVTIGKTGKGTLCSDLNLDFSGTDDVKAFVATGYQVVNADKSVIWLTRVKDVPAGTPVVLKANEGSYEIPTKVSSPAYYKNMLQGNPSDAAVTIEPTAGEFTNLIMSGGMFKSFTGSQTINPGKCYLQVPTTMSTTVGSAQSVTIGQYGKGTLCSGADLDFTDVEGLKAYTVSGYDNSTQTIWLTRVTRTSAGEPLLLKGDQGSYNIPSVGTQSYYVNMLVGNNGSSDITINATDGDLTNYILNTGQFKPLGSGSTQTITPGKAYLQIPSVVLTRAAFGNAEFDGYTICADEPEMMSMEVYTRGIDGNGDTTGINDALQSSQTEDVYYNLNGQRVDNPGKGLYIKNGRKVVIK